MKINHIPFKMPKRSFALSQEWRHLSFLHWRVDEKYILPYIPKGLELDTFNNNAYISTIPFLSDVFFFFFKLLHTMMIRFCVFWHLPSKQTAPNNIYILYHI